MAMIAQSNLFSWKNVEAASDLDRLRYVLEALPDEALMRQMEAKRGRGRDDYPVRPVFNSILAGIVYQHESIESLRRELSRNGELRELCGFDALRGDKAIPPPSAYTRFLRCLMDCGDAMQGMLDALVERLREALPDLGEHLAIDGKAISSAGKPTDKAPDGRRDADADWGVKKYKGKRKDGTLWEKVVSWFGFKVHLIVDAEYELPLAFEVTRASVSDTERLLPMMETLEKRHPELVAGAEDLAADRGYDSTDNCRDLYDLHKVKPILDIRHDWKDGETTRPLFAERADNIVYDEDGRIFCVAADAHDARETEMRAMAFCGFEKERMTLKYRCPAAAYGMECPERVRCGAREYGRVVRVPLTMDRRHFIPTPRGSAKFERLYDGRTAVERVNSRLDVSFGFERHFIRGLAKMAVRVGLALAVMLAMAMGAIRSGRAERMRSLVWTVPKPKAARPRSRQAA